MNPDPTPAAHLPAPLPSPAALLQRTQGALGLLRDVVQESSAEYWYAKGLSLSIRRETGFYHSQDKLLVPLSLNAFKRCYEIDPTHWRAAVRLSLALCIEGIFPDAADILLEAYKKTVSHEFEFYGELCFSEGYPQDKDGTVWFYDYNEWVTVRSSLTNQIKNNTACFNEYLSLALIQNLNKDWRQSKESLQLASSSYPELSEKSSIYFEIFASITANDWLLAKEKGWDNILNLALASYDRSIQLDPNRANLYLLRSDIKYRLRDFNGSLLDANRAVELHPSATSYESRESCNEILGNIEQAKVDKTMCMTLLHPIKHAMRIYDTQNYDGALAAFNQSIKLKPWHFDSYNYRAAIKNLLKDDVGAGLDLVIADLIKEARKRRVIKTT